MIDASFSRASFEAASDLQGLCARLSELLTARVRAATNIPMEVEWIVADLRRLGHAVQHWDGVISSWDDPHQDPYLWVWLEGVDLDEPGACPGATVGVASRPRLPQVNFRCPMCGAEMQDREIRLTVQGHGSAVAPGVRVHFECPGLKDLDGVVGVASEERRRAVRVCTSCGAGLLLPSAGQGGARS